MYIHSRLPTNVLAVVVEQQDDTAASTIACCKDECTLENNLRVRRIALVQSVPCCALLSVKVYNR
jgi:hypothetical protein